MNIQPKTCGAKTRAGTPCNRSAINGMPHCGLHAGMPRYRVNAEAAIRKELMRWGLDPTQPDIDPGQTLLALVQQSRQRVEFYAQLQDDAFAAAQRLHEAQLTTTQVLGEPPPVVAPNTDPDTGEDGYAVMPEDPAIQAARLDLDRIFATGGVGALIGTKKGVDRYGRVFDEEEAIRGLVRLEAEERDRLARFCKLALDAGIAERQVRIAETQGALLAGAVRAILGDLNLTPEQLQLVGMVVPRRLRELSGFINGEVSNG